MSRHTPRSDRRRQVRVFAAVVALLIVSPLTPPVANAAEGQLWAGCDDASALMNERSGTSRLARLSCDLLDDGTSDDTVTILEHDADDLSEQWWMETGSTTGGAWIFDIESDGQAEVIIDFRRADDGELFARIYDRAETGANVDYTIDGGRLVLRQDAIPTITVSTVNDWWHDDVRPNLNLDISVDGEIQAGFTPPEEHRRTDGVVDYSIQVRDTDNDGRPDYDWRTVHDVRRTPSESDRSFFRSYLMVNAADNEAPLQPESPWPFFGPLTYGYLTSSAHATSDPPIQADWSSGRVSAVGEFVSSRGNDAQWFVYSFEPIQSTGISQPDFEAPFAWYDLAEDQDRAAELAVRFGYYAPFDAAFGGVDPDPANIIRYSWDQNNDGFWDYKVGMLGRHLVSSSVTVGDLDLTLAPYADLPAWVADRPWDVVTFVAAEDLDYRGEGIYDWDPTGETEAAYFDSGPLAGVAESYNLGEGVGELQRGMRGEYALTYNEVVRLYVSPLDYKLHLTGAEYGAWNVSNDTVLTTRDDDGDGYIDAWEYVEHGRITRQVHMLDGLVLYAGNDEIVLKQAGDLAPILETSPPRTHEEWQALGDQLEEYPSNADASNLRAMLRHIPGESSRISGATLSGFRRTDTGFRAILTLEEGADLGSVPISGVTGPGRYALVYDAAAGQFQASASSAPDPVIGPIQYVEPPTQLSETSITVPVANQGVEDLLDVPLMVIAERPGYQPRLLAYELVDLRGEETLGVEVAWTPPNSGDWVITTRLFPSEPRGALDLPHMLEAVEEVQVREAEQSSWQATITGGWPDTPAIGYVAMLAGLTSVFAILGLLLVRRAD